MKTVLFFYLLAGISVVCISSYAEIRYQTDFEPNEGYTLGPLTEIGQNGWFEEYGDGSSSVVNSPVNSGLQAIRISNNSGVSKNLVYTDPVLYLEGYYQPPLTYIYPDLTFHPPASAVFIFHATQGLVGLDGNGAGSGQWVPSETMPSPGYNRITIKVDFGTKKWSLYLNQVLLFNQLGFKNNTVTNLNGVRIDSSLNGAGFLDTFSVSTEPPDFLIPTATPTASITNTNLPTHTPTFTASSSFTPLPTLSKTSTNTFIPTVTSTPTASETPISTKTNTHTTTFTPSPTISASQTTTPSITQTTTETPTLTETYTHTTTPSLSSTVTFSQTSTPSLTLTLTEIPTLTMTSTPTLSATLTTTETNIPTNSPTQTEQLTPTETQLPSDHINWSLYNQ